MLQDEGDKRTAQITWVSDTMSNKIEQTQPWEALNDCGNVINTRTVPDPA